MPDAIDTEDLRAYRTSEYTIYVELKGTERCLLLHGYTGAIDLVSKQVLHQLRSKSFSQMQKVDFEVLRKRGYITLLNRQEEIERAGKIGQLIHKFMSRTPGFVFCLTYDCNFRCPYCYEGSISGRGSSWTGETFAKNLVDAAFNSIEEIVPTPRKGSQLLLYGGEPLLRKNEEVVRYIVECGRRKGYTFGAITNGFEIDAYRDLLGNDVIQFLQVTLDGGAATHDNRRRHVSGAGTFDRISSNISLALDAGVKISLRINVDRNNLEDLDELARFIDESGWSKHNHFSCYVYPVYMIAEGGASRRSVTPEGIEGCLSQSVLLKKGSVFKYLAQRKGEDPRFAVFHEPNSEITGQIVGALSSRQAVRLKGAFCGANTGMLIFDPRGDVYTCWEQVGFPRSKVGSFFPKLALDKQKHAMWTARSIAALPACSHCKYALFCGGGCASHALQAFGDFHRSYCDEFPRMFQYYAEQAYQKHCSLKEVDRDVIHPDAISVS